MVVPVRPTRRSVITLATSTVTLRCDTSLTPRPMAMISAVTVSTKRISTATRAVTVSAEPPKMPSTRPPPPVVCTPNSETLPSTSSSAPSMRPNAAAVAGLTRPDCARSCSKSTLSISARSVMRNCWLS